MSRGGLSDLDELVLRCRNERARSYLEEAITCLKAGAFRASIVSTWVAVVHDLIAKLEQLELGGDKNAQSKLNEFRRIVEQEDVGASQKFEGSILKVAHEELELFGALAYVDLCRLREDRHRCAHPSMLDPETDYQPAPELARCHVVNAVTHLLEHGPAQGKAALDRLLSDLDQLYFPKTLDDLVIHLESGPLGHPRASLVRAYVLVLTKRLFETVESIQSEAGLLAELRARRARQVQRERILLTVQAVIRMHREVTLKTFDERLDDLVGHVADDQLGKPLSLCSRVPELWAHLAEAQRKRIARFVRSTHGVAEAMLLAWTIEPLRPEVVSRVGTMGEDEWDVMARATDVPAEWVEIAVEKLVTAKSWGQANSMRHFLVEHIHRIDPGQLVRIVGAAANDAELRASWGIKDVLAAAAELLGAPNLAQGIEASGHGPLFQDLPWWPTPTATQHS
jgi:hypothetical protein